MNRFELLKTLLPGFLPIIVFIAADAIWGTVTGLIVAIVFGILELIYTFFKERVVDKFILFDTGLIVLLGLVSLLMENDIFFMLKPALIEALFIVILEIL